MRELLAKHVPAAAVDYCHHLWLNYPFQLKLKKKRSSKLGDYTFKRSENKHLITVNADLNAYTFLITYLHEVAHLVVAVKYKGRQQPHGAEWKKEFAAISQPVLNTNIFPVELLRILQAYFKNPRASSYSYHPLASALKEYDTSPKTTIIDINDGSYFRINKKVFQKGLLRRTRYLCREVGTGKKYLISKSAEVEVV